MLRQIIYLFHQHHFPGCRFFAINNQCIKIRACRQRAAFNGKAAIARAADGIIPELRTVQIGNDDSRLLYFEGL